MPVAPELLALLHDAVGTRHVRSDPDVVAAHVVDWTGRFRGTTPAVVAPADTAQVAAVLRACHAHGAGVVPQGGNTGLVGGSIPLHDEIVLDLRRLDRLDPVDPRTGHVIAQCGVTLARLQSHARAAGWQYGVDLAARDVATVGGTIATNAGGVHVLRYGPTRRQLLGMEFVLADGRVVSRLAGLEKDNTGYDLAGLMCGSEGTLGVITAAVLRLVPHPAATVVALLAFDDIDAAFDAVGEVRRRVDGVQALEFLLHDGLELVCAKLELARPFPDPHVAYVLVEVGGDADPTESLGACVDEVRALSAASVATDAASSRVLWRYREALPEAINLEGVPHKLDVSLPSDAMTAFVHDVREHIARVEPRARVWLFGHAGDGNVHVNVTGVAPDDDRITDAVLRLVAARHGSISAEHGIGSVKRAYVHLVRSDEEIATYRAIKNALDPTRILNPHVLLPST